MFIKNKLTLLVFLSTILTLTFWAIFKFDIPQKISFQNSKGIYDIWSNYDGPNYLIIAKCWYKSECIGKGYSLQEPISYYPAHLPGFPLVISFFDNFTNGPWAMLLTTLLGNILLTIYFYRLASLYLDPNKAFWVSMLFLIFPGRFFVTKVVGAPESWFVGSLLASIYYYKKDKSLLSALFLGLAQSIKTPAIILLAAFFIDSFLKKDFKKFVTNLTIVLLTIGLIFSFYQLQTGDFFAYFNSGDNRHLATIPYQVFLSNQPWVQTIWLEEILYIFVLCFFGIYFLQTQYKLDIIVIFSLLFTLALIFVGHRDISRYASPLYPFLYLAFAPALVNKHTKIVFLLLLPAVFLYAINFVVGNTAPIADWAPYL